MSPSACLHLRCLSNSLLYHLQQTREESDIKPLSTEAPLVSFNPLRARVFPVVDDALIPQPLGIRAGAAYLLFWLWVGSRSCSRRPLVHSWDFWWRHEDWNFCAAHLQQRSVSEESSWETSPLCTTISVIFSEHPSGVYHNNKAWQKQQLIDLKLWPLSISLVHDGGWIITGSKISALLPIF